MPCSETNQGIFHCPAQITGTGDDLVIMTMAMTMASITIIMTIFPVVPLFSPLTCTEPALMPFLLPILLYIDRTLFNVYRSRLHVYRPWLNIDRCWRYIDAWDAYIDTDINVCQCRCCRHHHGCACNQSCCNCEIFFHYFFLLGCLYECWY